LLQLYLLLLYLVEDYFILTKIQNLSRMIPSMALRLDPYVGEFRALVREVVSRGWAVEENAEQRARDFIRECGCDTIILDRLDGRGAVEMIVQSR
jgi:hypothetical protein